MTAVAYYIVEELLVSFSTIICLLTCKGADRKLNRICSSAREAAVGSNMPEAGLKFCVTLANQIGGYSWYCAATGCKLSFEQQCCISSLPNNLFKLDMAELRQVCIVGPEIPRRRPEKNSYRVHYCRAISSNELPGSCQGVARQLRGSCSSAAGSS